LSEDIIGWSVVAAIAVAMIAAAFAWKRIERKTRRVLAEGLKVGSIPFVLRWKYMQYLVNRLHERWLSGLHKHLLILGACIATVGGVLTVSFQDHFSGNFMLPFTMFTLTSLLLYYELLRLVRIEWTGRGSVTSVIYIVLPFLISIGLSLEYSYSFSYIMYATIPTMFLSMVILILRPGDLARIRDEEIVGYFKLQH